MNAPSDAPAACGVCGDPLGASVHLSALLAELAAPVSEARRELLYSGRVTCGAGHCFCLSCWSAHTRTQVTDGAAALGCPGYKCGESLSAAWAPAVLSDELLLRWRDQRGGVLNHNVS